MPNEITLLLYFYSIRSVHLVQKCTLNTDQMRTKLKLNTMLMLNMKIHTKILKQIACVGQRLMYPIMERKKYLTILDCFLNAV